MHDKEADETAGNEESIWNEIKWERNEHVPEAAKKKQELSARRSPCDPGRNGLSNYRNFTHELHILHSIYYADIANFTRIYN